MVEENIAENTRNPHAVLAKYDGDFLNERQK